MTSARTTVCVAGGGPAGIVLGYLLARAGIAVTVLEKHGDFLRDFRGDTIHPSTAQLMDELGLGEQFAALPLRHSDTLGVVTDEGEYTVADFRRIPGRHTLAFLPQWDFLDFLSDQAGRYPGFDLRMRTAAEAVIRDGGRVAGVRARGPGGEVVELRTDLVVAADGRSSTLRAAAGMALVSFGAPIDVLWFRMPRIEGDPGSAFGRLARGHLMVMIDRGDYWQIGYVIAKGERDAVQARGLAAFREQVSALAPFLDGREQALGSWDDVRVLHVQLNRLRRWWQPGLLCIGDAAHAMSPVGGVGINLAIQDAVAAARILTPALRHGHVPDRHLARVQARRMLPTVLTQRAQRLAHDRVLGPVLSGRAGGRTPLALRALDRIPALRALPAYAVGHGVLPEHAPPDLPA
ncbi:MAG TPA: FAD-dependent oxidoreductase [Euzebyales bacterium]|nr:FAD-dependent oxidoreductase [Euzebyales bacterium]